MPKCNSLAPFTTASGLALFYGSVVRKQNVLGEMMLRLV
jgi:ammonia channel protein AmtB